MRATRTGCIEATEEKTFGSNEDVINQGDAGDHFYLVYGGTFEAYLAKSENQPVVASYKKGDGFGELALLYNSPRTYQRITRGKYKMPASFTPATKDFISRLLMHNPASRLGCSWSGSNEILTHTFYKESGVDFKSLERRTFCRRRPTSGGSVQRFERANISLLTESTAPSVGRSEKAIGTMPSLATLKAIVMERRCMSNGKLLSSIA